MQQTQPTLFDILHLSERKRKTGEIGVEIEMETNRPLPNVWGWNRLHDGSLRGDWNGEYVLVNPISKKSVSKRVEKLKIDLALNGVAIQDTVRAGVHIHVNVQDMSEDHFWKFLIAYLIVEELITDYCGEGRQGNHFCLRSGEGEYLIYMILRAIETNDIFILNTDEIRYSSLNLASLFKFGSVEFRALRTPTDLMDIIPWVNILLKLKRNCTKFSSPRHIIESLSMDGEFNLLETLLEEYASNFPREYETTASLRRGARIAQQLAYSIDIKPPFRSMEKEKKKERIFRELTTIIVDEAEAEEEPF